MKNEYIRMRADAFMALGMAESILILNADCVEEQAEIRTAIKVIKEYMLNLEASIALHELARMRSEATHEFKEMVDEAKKYDL